METGSGSTTAKIEPHAASPATVAYVTQITKLIKSAWARLVEQQANPPYGTAVISLSVDRHGQTINPHISSDTSNANLGQTGLRAVKSTKLPEMPEDAIKELDGKRVGLRITFDLLRESDVGQKSGSR